MSDNVIPLGARRQQSTRPLGYDGFTCGKCDGAWINLPVVVGMDGKIDGHGTKGTCVDCGAPVEIPIDLYAGHHDD